MPISSRVFGLNLLAAWGAVALLIVVSEASHAADPAVLASLKVGEEFSVELVAADPLVQHPVMATFDDRGRLLVADNAGLNLPAEELLKQLPNMIRMLEDTDGDGRFDKSTLYADALTFPQGAAWFRGALYVASPPSIWRFEDTDGDGRADRREELVQKFGFIGNAADIHGCFITPTGRIVWCDGRHGHEFKDGDGQVASKGLAARVFSCLPDGSDVEVFCGGGMDNPVEVTFMPDGDTIGTMTFYNPDAARHDALVHFVYGGVYPKKHPCTSEFKRTGDLMPALSVFGVTAPSGLTRYAGGVWGNDYRDNVFSTAFNTHKVLRHVLVRQGGTFRAGDEDFLTSTHADFHPTDVLQDADGSLLVIDTGGWFRIGCPTSQIAKPEIGGGIYRIRRKQSTPPADPWGQKIAWSRTSDTDMADLLADERPAVVERAIEELVTRGDSAMGTLATALFESTDYRVRQHGIWTLARIGTDNARLLLRQALADDDAPARLAAVHAVSDLRDQDSILVLIDLLNNDEPAVKREAATALGRLRKAAGVPALLAALPKASDRFVEHAVIYALIEIGDRQATLAGLQHADSAVRRGALIALDQMDGGNLTRELVTPLLATDDTPLLRAIVDVLSRHPDWSSALVDRIGDVLTAPNPSEEQLATARGAICTLVARPEVQALMGRMLSQKSLARATRLMLLESVALSELEALPPEWVEGLRASLDGGDAEVTRQAIASLAGFAAGPFTARLMVIGAQDSLPLEVRVAALRAAARSRPPLDSAAHQLLLRVFSEQSGAAASCRLAACEALAEFSLTDEQRAALLPLIGTCGPLELSTLMAAFENRSDAAQSKALVAALEKSPAAPSLRADRLRESFRDAPEDVRAALEKLLERSAAGERERAASLSTLEASLPDGLAARGELLFFGQRAACSACHRVSGRGEKIGPDLSKIGEVRTRRDLLEAIAFPSASLARGYESLSVVTKDGKSHFGLQSRESATAIYLRTTERAELRIDRGDIEEQVPSQMSIMPQGLDKALSAAELADVIAYLQSLK